MVLSADGLWELFLQTGIPEAYTAYVSAREAQEKEKNRDPLLEKREPIVS
ncbi:MAG: hypothetical protein ACI4PQ_05240 [Butyricicoccaceae bacterium]